MTNLLLIILCCAQVSFSARILFILPVPSYSHYVIGGVLSKAVAARGHHVTVIGPFPPEAEIENYRYINLEGINQVLRDILGNIDFFQYNSLPLITKIAIPHNMGYVLSQFTLHNKEVQSLLNSGEKFDAVVFELFNTEALYAVCHHFKAPCIPLTTAGMNMWTNRLTGNIGIASYVPNMITDLSPKMNFLERAYNLYSTILADIIFHYYALPMSNDLVQSVLPKTPHLCDLVYNTSLVLLNSHPALTTPSPLTPNMKEIGGVHIEGLKEAKLPEDIQLFLDKHQGGVIYFALGSSLKSEDLPKEKLQAIVRALKRWGKPVLWKFEGELPEKMEHIKTAKWLPQTAVLGHKNVKAFITHAGRLSTMESLYYGVPMVAISVSAEQPHNAAEMAHLGYAIWLQFKAFTSEDFYNALVEVTSNPKYLKEAKIRSKAMQRTKATDEAIYWIEHVIEFEGATYLRNAGVQLPWYQFWMVDVIASLALLLITVSSSTVFLVLRLVGKSKKEQKTKIH